MARKEADSLEDTSKSITWDRCEEGHYPESYGCGSFFKKLQKELKFKNSKGHWIFILPDGSAMSYYISFNKTARASSIPNFKVQGFSDWI